MRSCTALLAASATVVATASETDPASFLDAVSTSRRARPLPSAFGGSNNVRKLEDAAGNSYNYLDDLSGYNLVYGKCVRVKIPQENDDDGNAYFYNGKYHAPSAAYASFYLCDQSGNEHQCGTCDSSTQYVTELEDYLESQVEFAQNYCASCGAQCRRRRADDEDGDEDNGENDEDLVVDCSTCVDECALLLAGNEGNDETNYVECQESHQDENGLQYYTGPACDADTGDIVIGLYYDEDCTMKSHEYENNFAFNTFGTIEGMCVDCSNGYCDDLYGDAYHCYNGYDQAGNGDDDMPVCKTFKKATKEWTYATAKSKNKFVPILITVLVFGALGSVFAFLSFTYYIRHKRAEEALQEPFDYQDDVAAPNSGGGTLT